MSSIPPPPPLGDLPPTYEGRPINHKRAIASLVCGLLAIVFFPLVLGILAIVLGVQARQAIRSQPQIYTGDSMALAGIILGGFSLVSFLVIVAVGLT